jgi:hypothetical protein
MLPCEPVQLIGLLYRPAKLEIDSCAPGFTNTVSGYIGWRNRFLGAIKVIKYGTWNQFLAPKRDLRFGLWYTNPYADH